MPWYRAPDPRRFHLERLFRPKSATVIADQSRQGARLLGNLRAGAFKGEVLPLNLADPTPETVASGIAALPTAPDVAVLAIPACLVAAALAALGERGCAAAVVTGAAPGLAESARAAGVRVLGPDSFGVAIPALGLNATLAHLPVPSGRAALVAQSASLCRAVLDWAEPNGLGFSHIVGIGGNADIGFGMALDWLSRDPATGVILLEIQSIKDRRAFLSAARAAARQRAVIAMRPGVRLGDPGGDAEAVFEAALRRAGIITVTSLGDLLAAAETLTRARPARGETLAVLSNSVGAGKVAVDSALRNGIGLAELPAEARAALGAVLPGATSGAPAGAIGPLPIGLDSPMRLAETAAMLAALPEIGGILIVLAPEGDADVVAVEAIIACASTAKLPVLVCVLGATTGAAHRRRLADAGVPVFPGSDLAVRGFLRLVQLRRNRAAARELPPSNVLELEPDRDLVRRLFSDQRATGRTDLDQDGAARVLAAYDVPFVPMRSVRTGEDAAEAAEEIGFPAVLKLRRPESAGPGRPPGGPLLLGLADASAVRAAARDLVDAHPRAAERGFLVQRQVGRSRELLIQVRDDAMFGPTIRFGQGGSAADVLNDIAFDLPPLNLPLARALLARPRIAATFREFRDQPAANVEAIARTLVCVSQLVVDFAEIAELEINPLFADADGVLAADARICLRPPGEVGQLAIAPYPQELCQFWQTSGERLLIRPIRPEDAEAHRAFFQRLPAEDIRYRFFSPLRELSAETTARMTQIDYEREMAFIAERERDQATLGVARLVCEQDKNTAEFAVIVQPDMKGKGLATQLMRRLIDWARERGIAEIVGQVLADNAPMLAFARSLGFSVRHQLGEEDVLEARMALR